MIYLSAGHHNADSGAVGNGYKESDLTKEVRNLIFKNLDSTSVIQDKDSETNSQYQNRIKPGSGSVVFDIHFNSGPATATGVECFVNVADFKDKNSLSFKLAAEICELTARILKIKNRGVKAENTSQHTKIGILNLKAGISVLWEVAFISNENDMSQYQANKAQLTKEIASLLKKYDAMK